jgi:ribonuclease G
VIEAVGEKGNLESDRAGLEGESNANAQTRETIDAGGNVRRRKPEFKEERDKQRRVGSRRSMKPERAQVSIDQLLKEGQEILVQVAKDPIASKGARLTCHISLAGRHLVCMPTIDHVGVSRRIERDDDRRRLRDFVEKNRPGHMGFIVRTATSKKDPESWIKADMDYLELLWTNICEKAGESSAPSLIYQDLNPILRAVRDWIGEDVKRVLIDDREAFNDLKSFVDRYMPSLSGKIELYQGDIPVFPAHDPRTN